MAANRRWASREDWERKRPLIARLYIDEQRPLADVMAILKTEHGFLATARMFKDRLRKWGLYKYMTTNGAEPKGRRKNSGPHVKTSPASTPASSGQLLPKPPHAKHIEEPYEAPVHAIRERPDGCTAGTAIVPRSAVPRPLSTDKHNTFESIFRLFHHHLLADGTSVHVSYWKLESVEFYRTIENAARLLDANDTRAGFRALDVSFDHLQRLVDSAEYGIIPVFFISIARLPPEVAQQLLRFASRMTAIRLPRGHPLSRILDVIRHSRPGVIRESLHAIIRALFAGVEDRLGTASETAMLLESLGLDIMHFLDYRAGVVANFAALEGRTRALNARMERHGYTTAAQWNKIIYGYTCMRTHRYADARVIADGVQRWAETNGDDEQYTKFVRSSCHLHWQIERDIGSLESYTEAAVRFCRWCMATGQAEDAERAQTALVEIRAWFQERGAPELADKVVAECVGTSLV